MNTQIISIVAIVGGLLGTLLGALLGYLATTRSSKTAAETAYENTVRTLAEQREQLNKTLAEQRLRALNERFATAASLLGDDKSAVRLAGIYSMAALADDWGDNRQACIDVLCAYLRLPYEADPGKDADADLRAKWLENREVRHTVLRVIAEHLRPTVSDSSTVSWCGMDFDFTGAVLDGGNLSYIEFSSGRMSFIEAEFIEGTVYFTGSKFSGGRMNFEGAKFSGGYLDFRDCTVIGSTHTPPVSQQRIRHKFDAREMDWVGPSPAPGPLSFVGARFNDGGFTFEGAQLSGGTLDFREAAFYDFWTGFADAEFCGSKLDFSLAQFRGDAAHFERARLDGGLLDFTEARFFGKDSFFYMRGATFNGATVQFRDVKFAAPFYMDFAGAEFIAGTIDFSGARFAGARVSFDGTHFTGATMLLKNTEYYDGPQIYFPDAQLESGILDFADSKFYAGTLDFSGAHFAGCVVDFSKVFEWKRPPILPLNVPLPGLVLPDENLETQN